ncbi:4Fe-4S dicluster domain-containing protein [Desulforudis sp. 1088]|uniref:4Fe-4S dicluster domain-containing protein n=1 Tax=unclassified Candidatus Desulforudis TaxID=2635950 RepID=UPI003496EFCB
MPPMVVPYKCDGCLGESEPMCEQVCPGDLMTLDPATGKAVCRDPGDCWDCMTCTKVCPRQAIQIRIQYQLAYYPAKLIPLVGSDTITWTLIDSRNRVERFIIKTLAGEDDED